MHRRYDFAYDFGSQAVLGDGATGVKSGATIGRNQSARGSRNSSGLPASADDSGSYRLRGAGYRSSRGVEAGATFAGYVALRLPFAVKFALRAVVGATFSRA